MVTAARGGQHRALSPVGQARGGAAATIGAFIACLIDPAVPLSAPVARTHLHDRRATYRGYRRDDGLWDIEAELHDSKTAPFTIPGERAWAAGEPIHGMAIRLTVDDGTVVRAIEVAMDHVPHGPCPQAAAPMQRLVGCRLARGWRKSIEQHLGGIQGCAHLRELLFNMATAAFQTMVPSERPVNLEHPPPHLGKCLTWDFDGPVVQRHYPKFYRLQPAAPRASGQGSPDGPGGGEGTAVA